MYRKIEPNNKIFKSTEFEKDKYKFNIVSKILAGDEVLLYSDEENYFLARNKAGMPTWIWTRDGLDDGLKPLLYTDYSYIASNKAYINAGYEDKGILINFSCSREKKKNIKETEANFI